MCGWESEPDEQIVFPDFSSGNFRLENLRAFMKPFLLCAFLSVVLCGYAQIQANDGSPKPPITSETYNSIYWSDGDSGRLRQLKFRLANIDAPETGSLKQRGGAKCEFERELGFEAKAYMVGFTKEKTMRIVRDYGEDRYGRLVIDIEADGFDVGNAGVEAGHLRDWLHIKGRAQSPKPDWCEGRLD